MSLKWAAIKETNILRTENNFKGHLIEKPPKFKQSPIVYAQILLRSMRSATIYKFLPRHIQNKTMFLVLLVYQIGTVHLII